MWILAILLLVILIIILVRPKKYSWSDFSRKFKDCMGEFGVYDLTKKTIESTYVDKKIIDTYDTIFTRKIPENVTYMLKISESNASGCELDILNYVKPITDKYNASNIIVRIQTNPWRHAPHFDAFDQTAYMLSGMKKWILWDVDFINKDEALTFRDDINNLNSEQLKTYLTNRGIPYETKLMKPHDSLYIKRGRWHYVENVNTTRGCIMLNLHTNIASHELDNTFGDLWPEQQKRCKNNQFY